MTENEKVVIELMANSIRNTEFEASASGDLPAALAASAYDALPEHIKLAIRGANPATDAGPGLVTVTLPRGYWSALVKAGETALAS